VCVDITGKTPATICRPHESGHRVGVVKASRAGLGVVAEATDKENVSAVRKGYQRSLPLDRGQDIPRNTFPEAKVAFISRVSEIAKGS
jgi:hypothetical protein